MSVCSCCKKSFDTSSLVTCIVCNKSYRNACVELTTNEVKLLNGNKGVEWSCKSCKESGCRIGDLKALILQLQNDIQSLKNQMKLESSLSEDDYEEIISEINARNSKKSNIVIFGLSEPNQNINSDARQESDTNQVINILKSVLPDENFENAKPVRLGKYEANKNRIIKVALSNEITVRNLMKNATRLKNSQNYRNISISADRTKREIEYYKKIKNQMLERNNNGENCKMKYINGIPRIIDLNL